MRKSKNDQRVIAGQPSWRVASDQVEAFVTELGGHLGPVTFDRNGRKFQPYSVAPWAQEKQDPSLPPIIQALRGDFFCLPFGGNDAAFRGERHPVHGETANARWRFESLERREGRTSLNLSLETKIRPGTVDKRIRLLDGQNNVYTEHVIRGMKGAMCFGHHAMLKFPDEQASGILSTSRFVYGQVFPGAFELPEKGGYPSLKQGAEFDSLQAVPMATGETADLTRFPARRGFEDLVVVVSDSNAPFAWTAVCFPKLRYVWFALKNPRVLRHTVIWMSNGGRHYPPWSGRHVNVMALEEVTSYFHFGLAESARENPVSKKGYPTHVQLTEKEPFIVRYIMGMVEVPSGFDRVVSVETDASSQIILQSRNGLKAVTAVDLRFLDLSHGNEATEASR